MAAAIGGIFIDQLRRFLVLYRVTPTKGIEMSNTFVDIDELLETEKNLLRTIGSQSETIVKLEEEVAKLREMASILWNYTDCFHYPSFCPSDDPEPCKVCAVGRVVEGWEEGQ